MVFLIWQVFYLQANEFLEIYFSYSHSSWCTTTLITLLCISSRILLPWFSFWIFLVIFFQQVLTNYKVVFEDLWYYFTKLWTLKSNSMTNKPMIMCSTTLVTRKCKQNHSDKFYTKTIHQEMPQVQSLKVSVDFFTAWCVLGEHHWWHYFDLPICKSMALS